MVGHSSQKTIQILDNELRLRSLTNHIVNHIGRFDELTHFFNVIIGLFHQPSITFGLSTLSLSEFNLGMNMYLDENNFKHEKIDFFRNLILFGLIGNNSRRTNQPLSSIKFHTLDNNLIFNVNYQWTPSLMTIFRLRTMPQKRFSSQLEYKRANETFELLGTYDERNLSSIQLSYLSSLWTRKNCQLDGGIDLRITSKEKLLDIGFRLRSLSNSFVFKFDAYHPVEHYLIAIQRYINNNLTMGLLAEKYSSRRPPKFSLMSQFNLNKTNSRIHTLLNTENEYGLVLTHQLSHFPLVFQLFGLYSWTRSKSKYGFGLQILL